MVSCESNIIELDPCREGAPYHRPPQIDYSGAMPLDEHSDPSFDLLFCNGHLPLDDKPIRLLHNNSNNNNNNRVASFEDTSDLEGEEDRLMAGLDPFLPGQHEHEPEDEENLMRGMFAWMPDERRNVDADVNASADASADVNASVRDDRFEEIEEDEEDMHAWMHTELNHSLPASPANDSPQNSLCKTNFDVQSQSSGYSSPHQLSSDGFSASSSLSSGVSLLSSFPSQQQKQLALPSNNDNSNSTSVTAQPRTIIVKPTSGGPPPAKLMRVTPTSASLLTTSNHPHTHTHAHSVSVPQPTHYPRILIKPEVPTNRKHPHPQSHLHPHPPPHAELVKGGPVRTINRTIMINQVNPVHSFVQLPTRHHTPLTQHTQHTSSFNSESSNASGAIKMRLHNYPHKHAHIFRRSQIAAPPATAELAGSTNVLLLPAGISASDLTRHTTARMQPHRHAPSRTPHALTHAHTHVFSHNAAPQMTPARNAILVTAASTHLPLAPPALPSATSCVTSACSAAVTPLTSAAATPSTSAAATALGGGGNHTSGGGDGRTAAFSLNRSMSVEEIGLAESGKSFKRGRPIKERGENFQLWQFLLYLLDVGNLHSLRQSKKSGGGSNSSGGGSGGNADTPLPSNTTNNNNNNTSSSTSSLSAGTSSPPCFSSSCSSSSGAPGNPKQLRCQPASQQYQHFRGSHGNHRFASKPHGNKLPKRPHSNSLTHTHTHTYTQTHSYTHNRHLSRVIFSRKPPIKHAFTHSSNKHTHKHTHPSSDSQHSHSYSLYSPASPSSSCASDSSIASSAAAASASCNSSCNEDDDDADDDEANEADEAGVPGFSSSSPPSHVSRFCGGINAATPAHSPFSSSSSFETAPPEQCGSPFLCVYSLFPNQGVGIEWINREVGIFHICNSRLVAKIWGIYKHKHNLSYDAMARSLRHYYKQFLMMKIGSRRLVYQFCTECVDWSTKKFGKK